MKFKYILASIVCVLFLSLDVMAYVVVPFHGWDEVEAHSPDVVIIFTEGPASYPPGVNMSGPKYYYNAAVEFALKGTNSSSSTTILTDHSLRRHRRYLVFSQYYDGGLNAFEGYRVIPLEESFDLHSIEGKSMDQQLQMLFKSGIREMNKKIQEDEADKKRMQEALHQ